jgi:L-malate glycosyltransferase
MNSSSRIKICFVIDTIESPTAGTEKQLLLLLEHLDRTRFEPVLCVLRSSKWLKESFNLCYLYEIGINSLGSITGWLAFFRFVRFLRSGGVETVQAHFRDGSIVGILAAKMAGIKNIIGTRRNQGFWLNRKESAIQKMLNCWTSVFIANSKSTKEWACRSELIPDDKIHVIFNGVELGWFTDLDGNARAAARQMFSISTEVPVIGVIANLRPVKGIDVFLLAARKVLEVFPAAKFVIVGEGPERNHLESLAIELGIDSKVLFLGRRMDIVSILATFDVGVLSSHSESFSNSLVEYLAAGLPVVATDVGGAREAIIEGDNGYVVPVGDHMAMSDKIMEILAKGKGDMGEISKTIAKERFSLATMVTATENLYVCLPRAMS